MIAKELTDIASVCDSFCIETNSGSAKAHKSAEQIVEISMRKNLGKSNTASKDNGFDLNSFYSRVLAKFHELESNQFFIWFVSESQNGFIVF